MSKTEKRNDKGPDKEESIPTASMGGSAVGPGGQSGRGLCKSRYRKKGGHKKTCIPANLR
ncbi:MAG: hypothetical protein FVQ85_16300 [Planctomycetes bacterium]|nr:hypothetical protein [Planctomycetota bacterium]